MRLNKYDFFVDSFPSFVRSYSNEFDVLALM